MSTLENKHKTFTNSSLRTSLFPFFISSSLKNLISLEVKNFLGFLHFFNICVNFFNPTLDALSYETQNSNDFANKRLCKI